jgi:hypothetical protein
MFLTIDWLVEFYNLIRLVGSLCTDVTLDEARERTSVSWMKIPCSGHMDFPQICGKASDWTVLYLNNIIMTNENISLVN